MTGRSLDRRIGILAAVALLLAVMSSPIRPTGASHTATYSNHFLHKLILLEIEHGGQFTISARPSFKVADSFQPDFENELDADIEDELSVTSPPASMSFEVLPSPSPETYLERDTLAFTPAARPLRC